MAQKIYVRKLKIADGITGIIEIINPLANKYRLKLNVKTDGETPNKYELWVIFNHPYNLAENRFEPNENKYFIGNGRIRHRQWDYKSLDEMFHPFASDIVLVYDDPNTNGETRGEVINMRLEDTTEKAVRNYFNKMFQKNRRKW